MNKLFSDMKTDEEKSAFFLSGRGYETGVIAAAIQNDVAMAYRRCAEYKKELTALQAAHEEELFCIRQDRDAHFGELMRALEQVDAMKAECEKLRAAMIEAKGHIDHYMYGGSSYRKPAAEAIALIDAALAALAALAAHRKQGNKK